MAAACFFLHASDFGEAVWTGRATQHIRQGLEGKITLKQLNEVWSVISPISYVDRFAGRDLGHLIVTATEDEVLLPHLTERIVEAYRQNRIHYTKKSYRCGHYTLAIMPYKLYALAALLKLLKESL
ncbi:MAG: hypothetical protein O6941_06585 [Planctomycetota bacterium]|nr:hypothetical protein [Planctomycetota bacterium]